MRWKSRSSPTATIAGRIAWLVVLLLAVLVPLAMVRLGLVERPRALLPLAWLVVLGALAWLLLWAHPSPFGTWDPDRPRTWRRWLQRLALPVVMLSWVQLQRLAGFPLDRSLSQILLCSLVLAVVLPFQRWTPRTPEEEAARAERRRVIGRWVAVAIFLYAIFGLLFLWWLLEQFR